MPDFELISGIPLVDFSAMSIDHAHAPNPQDESVQTLCAHIHRAFSTVGFVYLKNHGIGQDQLNGILDVVDEFFSLTPEVKSCYAKSKGTSLNGWDALERERTNLERPGDLKESFDFGAIEDDSFNWPTKESPDFQPRVVSFHTQLKRLALRVLSAMAIGLGLEPDVFEPAHKCIGTPQGGTLLRFNYYPSIADKSQIKPGQIRCGEHTDYGSITLLFQDDAGGLEVKHLDGNYVPAPPISGTVLVNIADLMQRWTSDKLISTFHRVMIPESELKRVVPRRSLVFFVIPDQDALITCLDGSRKYPPVKSGEYVEQLLEATYKF